MSEPSHIQNKMDFGLANAGALGNIGEVSNVSNFRNPIASTSTEPYGHSLPPLPPRPEMGYPTVSQGMMQPYGGMQYGMGNYGGFGYGGYGGGYGMGGMGAMGLNGMAPYGAYNRYGSPLGYGDIESRFIQLAEENSRPAFDSIQSLVSAVGSIAMMLENTFFALTSSFRAILGVAENFGRLRTVFAQFWSTFAVIRTLNWIFKKLLVMLGIRSETEFKAWAEAVAATRGGDQAAAERPPGSSWPILLFFGVIAAAPYIVLKMLSGLTSTINENLNDPNTWQDPLRAIAQYDFQATRVGELSFRANQLLSIAPQHLQTHLWNTGWLMATTDRKEIGLVPLNYIKIMKTPTDSESKTDVDPNEFDKFFKKD